MNDEHLTDEQLTELLFGLLDEEARAIVEAHLEKCGRCAKEVELLRSALELSAPAEVAPAPPEQADATWNAIVRAVEAKAGESPAAVEEASASSDRRRSAPARGGTHWAGLAGWLEALFPRFPRWSWQVVQVLLLAGIGFVAAWYLAGSGWLPGTGPDVDVPARGRAPSPEATRGWLAASGYSERLELLLVNLARAQNGGGESLTDDVKQVSRDLLGDARWYRRAADSAGDPLLTELLAQVEIILLAVSTVPEGQEDELVTNLRELIDEEDILWRLRSLRGPAGPERARRVSAQGT